MTLTQTVEQFLEQYRAKTTQSAYRDALHRFFAAAECVTVDQVKAITFEDIPSVVRHLTCGPASVKHTLSAARSFYGFLRQEDRAVVDPTLGFKAPSIGDNAPMWNVLHKGEAQEVLAVIKDLHDRAVFLALVMQGWRVSELCALQWKNIRQGQDGEWIVEWKGKRGKQRVQGLQAPVLDAVRALGGVVKGNAPFLPTPKGEPWTRFEVYGLVTRYAKKAGKRVTPHGLRASYISSIIARKGLDAARQLAGHESADTTSRYSRWTVISDDKRTIEDL